MGVKIQSFVDEIQTWMGYLERRIDKEGFFIIPQFQVE